MSQEGTLNRTIKRNTKSITKALLLVMIIIASSISIFADNQSENTGSKTVTLIEAGETRTVKTVKPTVQQLLWQEFVVLGTYDRCSPSLQTPIKDGMTITVDKVKCVITTKNVTIPKETITRYSPLLANTAYQVLDPGQDGVREEKTKTWYLNGVQTKVDVVPGKVITAAKPTIILKGNGGSRGMTVKKSIQVVATAYEPGPTSCGKYANGYTATGMKAGKGVIAVDPKVIPLGTKVYVEGYGMAVAADVGGATKGNKIDVCMDTVAECKQWGRKTVTLHILQ